jgi:polyhydroxyalkanoate synthase subunit PhaC
MADLLERWAALWRVGLQDAWQQYASAQESLLAYGRSQTGQTPASVIYEEGRMRVLRYEPQGDSRSAGPLLCIPSLINRYYVMDLTPERSLIRSLLLQGVDVYMLDWGTATDVDRHRPLDEYIAGLLGRATAAVQDAGGHRRISLLGYCMGGVMAAVYAVLRPGDVATLINLAGPVNYHDDGIYS